MQCDNAPAWRTERPGTTLSKFPAETPPAMAYIPFQQEMATYSPEEALCAGTLFPVLDKPFTGKRGVLR